MGQVSDNSTVWDRPAASGRESPATRPTSESKPGILVEAETCWRVCAANRAAVLIDGESYFSAVRSAILQARRSVFIVGWDIDSRVRLAPDAESTADGVPDRLGSLLNHVAAQRPDVRIHLLLWDYSILFALEREPLPALNLGWKTPPQVNVCLDDVLPLGASHHQKIVVVDDAVAFCGGLDLTVRRWDTSEHLADHPHRVDPQGEPYAPFHDVQMAVDGDAAVALAELVRARWAEAACETPIPVEPTGDPWPAAATPDFTDIRLGIARTVPALYGRSEIREVEALYLRAIDAAERFLYVENQYLATDRVAAALARRLRERPELEALLVSPKEPHGWVEAKSMGIGRARFRRRLEEAGVGDRVRFLYPTVDGGSGEVPVMVHAKLMVVDDVFLRIGSANLNNRSMGLDTECDLAIEAANDRQRGTIAAIRNRLLAEHLGTSMDAVRETLAASGSLLATAERHSGNGRTLKPIQDDHHQVDELSLAVRGIADPERPIEAEQVVGEMFGAEPTRRPLGRLAKLSLLAALFIGLVVAWRYSPLADLADPARLQPWFHDLSSGDWAYVLVPLVYVAGGLVAFPITVLIALTAVTFGPWSGFALASVGALLSATVTYQLGALAGRGLLRDVIGRRINRISRALGRRGIVSVVTVRIVPVAPFTFINLVAGASHIDFRDYLLGTVLGMLPGVVMMTVLGDRLRGVWESPTSGNLALVAAVVGGWVLLSLALQAAITGLDRRNDG